MTSVKGMDPLEASSSAIHLPSEVGINQVVKSEKVINYSSWKYVPELFLDVIKDSEGGTQEITTTQQLDLWTYMRRRKEHRYLSTSETNQKPRGYPISVPCSSAPGFGE